MVEPQDEAEQILQQFQVDTLGVAASPGYVASEEYMTHRSLLLAVLAAVIEVYDSGEVVGTEWGEYKVDMDRFAWERMRDALSALRAREK